MGVVTTLLCTTLVGTAYAAGQFKSIKVIEGGISLYVDGKLVKPTDVKGNVVEPFIYDGSTYLPLRALSNALTNNEKEVSWDSKTSTIYVGQAPVAAQTEIDKMIIYDGSGRVYTGENASFKILDKTITPFNRFHWGYTMDDGRYYTDVYTTYMLHSNYSKLYGKLVVPYTKLGIEKSGTVQFFSVDRYGVETKIDGFVTSAGDETMDIEVDLRGVEILKIHSTDAVAFYNVTLEGIK